MCDTGGSSTREGLWRVHDVGTRITTCGPATNQSSRLHATSTSLSPTALVGRIACLRASGSTAPSATGVIDSPQFLVRRRHGLTSETAGWGIGRTCRRPAPIRWRANSQPSGNARSVRDEYPIGTRHGVQGLPSWSHGPRSHWWPPLVPRLTGRHHHERSGLDALAQGETGLVRVRSSARIMASTNELTTCRNTSGSRLSSAMFTSSSGSMQRLRCSDH